MSFKKINLSKSIQKALIDEGYSKPTPIQERAIPVILQGMDLLGCAQTGTGKTAAFALPILQLLNNRKSEDFRKKAIRSLIITPTRELAVQIEENFKAYGKYTGLKTAVVFGGVKQRPQTDKLKKGVDILIATPGRLLDLINQTYISLHGIELFVLDEADRMLDMGFIHDIKKIIGMLPAKRQSLFFSATMPPEIVKLARTILHKPVKIEIIPESPTAEKINQSIYYVAKSDKKKLLVHLLKDPAIESALVFTRTKHGADNVARYLNRGKIQSEAIHGDKGQSTRQRALNNFKSKKTRVLVATDIAARGIDIDELSHVINFEIPNQPETYVHRIGRTGRAGLEGIALSLCDTEEKEYLKSIHKLITKPINVVEDHPFTNGSLTSEKPKQQNRNTSAENPKHQNKKTKAKKNNLSAPKFRQADSSDSAYRKSKRRKKRDSQVWTNYGY